IPEYMIGVLLSEDFNESMVLQASGANYPAVNDKIVLDYEIANPPRKEQEAFAQFYNDSNECKSRLNQALKTTDTMLKSYLETVMV
ncbi:MAG: hypothetical protein IKS14_04025, partial [Thermoguttaceae bacterium]|nr:hypothetical protein [Thermoguttaceae bacterium]